MRFDMRLDEAVLANASSTVYHCNRRFLPVDFIRDFPRTCTKGPPMAAFPNFPSLDLTRFDLSRVDLSRVDLSRVKVPTHVARDVAYVGIGLTVLAVQQTQVRRRELQKELERTVRLVADRIG
jgi:hypothetical protein